MRVTAYEIAHAIAQLPRNRAYLYVNPRNRGRIKVVDVQRPQGPIMFKRWRPDSGETEAGAATLTISTQMIWRLANAFVAGKPINVDRIFGGSYNSRSVLEALIANTPQFYFCHPGRVEDLDGRTEIRGGHKHLVWLPNETHLLGELMEHETKQVISEIPASSAVYDALAVPPELLDGTIDIEMQRRHAQIQIALIEIGQQLGFRTWVARNDRGIQYRGTTIGQLPSVITHLEDEQLMVAQALAAQAGSLIDCIWFKNGRLMPAVMEVEHSTGITSGLTRMKTFKDLFPPFPTRYIIVAPDKDRQKFIDKASISQFADLNAQYFPYSSVEELYSLCQRRHITGVTEDFLDSFIEPLSGMLTDYSGDTILNSA